MKKSLKEVLDSAWRSRESNGALAARDALRIYHGLTEGMTELPLLAIEKFQNHYWVYEWESELHPAVTPGDLDSLREFLEARGAESAVLLRRPRTGIPAEDAEVLLGIPPEVLWTREAKDKASLYEIHFQKSRHPGLFLDHFPLRQWLHANSKDRSLLNTFAYTGSLSIAAAAGGASEVVTLDLSRPTTEWGKRNWEKNRELFSPSVLSDFIYGDVFEWLPKMKKRGKKFDQVILDPPSFSRTKKGNFSTTRDLEELHQLALSILAPEGTLITSINSEKVSLSAFQNQVAEAARSAGRKIKLVQELHACPQTFPRATYLKGGIYRVD